MKKIFLTIIGLTFASSLLFSAEKKMDDRLFQISRNLDIFNSIYKELDLFYVDSIKPEKTIQTGINAMLQSLDPYTNYIPESEIDKLKFMTTGEYAGIGCVISKRNNDIYVTDIYEGMPAYKGGIMVGDIIVEIEGTKTTGLSTSNVSEILKGEPKTTVHIVTEKPLTKKRNKITITREKIMIPAIQYYDVIADSIGYIGITSFTEKAAAQFKEAFLELRDEKGIKGLIIDLRNNPGGILDEAVNIVNLFVDKKSTIVYTKGKNPQWDEVYKATKDPIDKEIPIVVIVNRNSASASEILAGALQDLDRAVIIGERTYGKGLVQTTRDLPFGGNLKVTISKYYIPSGRCIQAIDYSQRGEDGYALRIPDSLTNEFKTLKGRIVRDGGGINPDTFIETRQNATISYHLYQENIIFDYATEYQQKHQNIGSAKEFKFTDYDEFKDFVKSKDFSYQLKTEEILKTLKEVAKDEGYLKISEKEFNELEKKLTHDLDKDLDLFKDEISELISIEINKRYHYTKGETIEFLKNDSDKNKAVEILKNKKIYSDFLTPKTTIKK